MGGVNGTEARKAWAFVRLLLKNSLFHVASRPSYAMSPTPMAMVWKVVSGSSVKLLITPAHTWSCVVVAERVSPNARKLTSVASAAGAV